MMLFYKVVNMYEQQKSRAKFLIQTDAFYERITENVVTGKSMRSPRSNSTLQHSHWRNGAIFEPHKQSSQSPGGFNVNC